MENILIKEEVAFLCYAHLWNKLDTLSPPYAQEHALQGML